MKMNETAGILIEEDEAYSKESIGFDFSYISNHIDKDK
jgi:hypothetical protein